MNATIESFRIGPAKRRLSLSRAVRWRSFAYVHAISSVSIQIDWAAAVWGVVQVRLVAALGRLSLVLHGAVAAAAERVGVLVFAGLRAQLLRAERWRSHWKNGYARGDAASLSERASVGSQIVLVFGLVRLLVFVAIALDVQVVQLDVARVVLVGGVLGWALFRVAALVVHVGWWRVVLLVKIVLVE